MNKKFKAFTLAEVLITLTIIGVIAALTIPNLMQSYKKHEVEVKLKEAYAILSNVLKMATAEYGDEVKDTLPDADNPNRIDTNIWIDKYIRPYIKVEKDLGTYNPNGNYKIYEFNSNQASSLNPQVNEKILRLANGMNLIIFRNLYEGTIFIVDLDGSGGRNRFAYDVFGFSIYYQHGFSLQGGYIPDGNIKSWYNVINGQTYYCSTRGTACSHFIRKNGWKIPDDYPVKKW